MRRFFTVLLAAGAFSAGSALAQPPVTHDPAQVEAGRYKLEPDHARIQFAVSHMQFTTYNGDFVRPSGELYLNPQRPMESRVRVSIPTASVSTTNAKLDEELRSSDWLDAARYPEITFVSTRVEPTGPGTARVTGDLTLHGVTRSVTLEAKFNAAGVNMLDHQYTAGFDAHGVLRRSDFGVGKYVPLVGDEVEVRISAGFEKLN